MTNSKEELFKILEGNFLTYKELIKAKVSDNGEKMLSLSDKNIRSSCLSTDIKPSTGDNIFVRESVAKRLIEAQEKVDELLPGYFIEVIYGYRQISIQEKNYNNIKEKILSNSDVEWEDDDLKEEIHRFIAVPEVAGHPTGGAIDIRLVNVFGEEVDMGSPVHEFTKESYVFYPFIKKSAWLNRQKLRQAMLSAGFAPFDGEWWHFSYGDREWAIYYNKPSTLYNQIEL